MPGCYCFDNQLYIDVSLVSPMFAFVTKVYGIEYGK